VAVEIHKNLEEMRKLAPLAFIAARVKRARRECEPRASHDEIARRMGGTFRQTLINWEKAKNRPSLQLLERYAEATGRPVEWFLNPDLDPSPFQEEAA
jgi:transcriptional regulator with XRE-family HTH domain